MFRTIIIALAGAAALSAGAAQAGGSCSTKGGGHRHVQHRPVQHRQPHYAQKVYVKPVRVAPIFIEPVKVCYYKVFYKQPCWDYQKQLTFNSIGEAKQMAQMFYDNGFKVGLVKYEGFNYDKTGYGKTGGPLVGGQPLPTGQVQSQILFEGTGRVVNNQGPPAGGLGLDTPLLDKPMGLGQPQSIDLPLVLTGAE